MLGEREKSIITGRAEGAVTSKRFVKRGAAVGGILQNDVNGGYCEGVSKFDIASGNVGTIVNDGDTLVTAGEAVALGDEISSTNTGKAQVAATGEHILGTALNATSADGDDLLLRWTRGKVIKPA